MWHLSKFLILLLLFLLLYLSPCLVLEIWKKRLYLNRIPNFQEWFLLHSLLIQYLHLLILSLLILLLCLLILHFLLVRWIILLLQTWIFVLHYKKLNDLVLSILFLILFYMIILPHYLISLPCLRLLFLYLSFIRKHWCTWNGGRSWMMRWMLSSHVRLGILCLLHMNCL